MKADDALSEAARQKISRVLHITLSQHPDDQQRAVLILVMQRLHKADLAGELIEKGGWHELRLPALTTDDHLMPAGSCGVGGRVPQVDRDGQKYVRNHEAFRDHAGDKLL